MRTVARVGMFVVALGGALALAGCAAAGHVAGPTAPASASALSSPAPGPSKPALSKLVVSPDGLGYLVLGQPVPDVSGGGAIVTYDATKCVVAGGNIAAGSPGAGAWVPTYPDGLTWAGSGVPFDVGPVTAATEAIQVIEIWSPDVKTDKGVGVGSTAAQLTRAYGSKLTVDRADNSDVYVLSGAHSELLFEVAKAAAGLPVEETGTVVWMRIVPLGTTQLHIVNTDDSGVCAS